MHERNFHTLYRVLKDFSVKWNEKYTNFNVNPIFAVTDPPYGIREPAAKVGTTKDQKEAIIPEEYLGNHIPQKIDYGLGDIFVDLLAFANLHMPCKGRLAFWMPVNREFYRCPNLNSSKF